MTDTEKQQIARLDMLKIESICKQVINLYQKREELYTSLYGSAIRYDKERVQTTPVNKTELILCEAIDDIDTRLNTLIANKHDYLNNIYKMPTNSACNLLIEKHVYLRSFTAIAKRQKIPKTSIFRQHKQALLEYYNTISCI